MHPGGHTAVAAARDRKPEEARQKRQLRSPAGERGTSLFGLVTKHIGSVDPHALKIPTPKGGIYSLTENALFPFQAERDTP
jgi:hypothetical protein